MEEHVNNVDVIINVFFLLLKVELDSYSIWVEAARDSVR